MSVLGDVMDEIIVQILTTSVEVAHDGTHDKDSTFPYANVHMDDFTFDIEIDSTYDTLGTTTIWIHAKSMEAVRTAGIEVVSALLDTTTTLYSGTNLFNIQPESMNLMVNVESSNTIYQASLTFRTQIRFTI